MKDFKQFITEEKEIKVGSYQTTHHYMCPSAIKFLKKHMRMDHDIKDLEKKAQLDFNSVIAAKQNLEIEI